MESFVYKLIPVDDIASEYPYCSRYSVVDSRLRKSIAARGVLLPIVLTSDSPKVIVAGHRRVDAAKAVGLKQIGAFEIQEACSPKDLFLFAMISNWNHGWSDLDRAWTLRKAMESYGFDETKAINELLPALGLLEERYVLNQCLTIARLSPALLDLIASGKLPFRGAQILARFTPPNQQEFAEGIGSKIPLTTNELIQTGEWLYDLLKPLGIGIQKFLKEKQLDGLLNHPDWSPRAKAQKFVASLRMFRFPKLTAYEKKFRAILGGMNEAGGDLKFEVPQAFEGEGFWLRARIRNQNSLDHILNLLKDKRDLLNSLFDIML
jgi:hypothetical protein